jgi:hypothetical protein
LCPFSDAQAEPQRRGEVYNSISAKNRDLYMVMVKNNSTDQHIADLAAVLRGLSFQDADVARSTYVLRQVGKVHFLVVHGYNDADVLMFIANGRASITCV